MKRARPTQIAFPPHLTADASEKALTERWADHEIRRFDATNSQAPSLGVPHEKWTEG